MRRVRTTIAITGVTEDEAKEGIPHLLKEFSERPWLIAYDAKWDTSKLNISVESEGDLLDVQGGTTEANFDDVWDCVIATVYFSSERIHFDIVESQFVEDEGDKAG